MRALEDLNNSNEPYYRAEKAESDRNNLLTRLSLLLDQRNPLDGWINYPLERASFIRSVFGMYLIHEETTNVTDIPTPYLRYLVETFEETVK